MLDAGRGVWSTIRIEQGARAMETQIFIIITVTALVGFCGGIIFAHIFELPSEREARLRAKRRRDRRNARTQKRRENVNFTIDKF
jgi:hypothetical protein